MRQSVIVICSVLLLAVASARPLAHGSVSETTSGGRQLLGSSDLKELKSTLVSQFEEAAKYLDSGDNVPKRLLHKIGRTVRSIYKAGGAFDDIEVSYEGSRDTASGPAGASEALTQIGLDKKGNEKGGGSPEGSSSGATKPSSRSHSRSTKAKLSGGKPSKSGKADPAQILGRRLKQTAEFNSQSVAGYTQQLGSYIVQAKQEVAAEGAVSALTTYLIQSTVVAIGDAGGAVSAANLAAIETLGVDLSSAGVAGRRLLQYPQTETEGGKPSKSGTADPAQIRGRRLKQTAAFNAQSVAGYTQQLSSYIVQAKQEVAAEGAVSALTTYLIQSTVVAIGDAGGAVSAANLAAIKTLGVDLSSAGVASRRLLQYPKTETEGFNNIQSGGLQLQLKTYIAQAKAEVASEGKPSDLSVYLIKSTVQAIKEAGGKVSSADLKKIKSLHIKV